MNKKYDVLSFNKKKNIKKGITGKLLLHKRNKNFETYCHPVIDYFPTTTYRHTY